MVVSKAKGFVFFAYINNLGFLDEQYVEINS
jgi:hypothetical protein